MTENLDLKPIELVVDNLKFVRSVQTNAFGREHEVLEIWRLDSSYPHPSWTIIREGHWEPVWVLFDHIRGNSKDKIASLLVDLELVNYMTEGVPRHLRKQEYQRIRDFLISLAPDVVLPEHDRREG